MNKPVLYVLIGIPASGKSTIAKSFNCSIVSLNDIGFKLYGSEKERTNNKQVFEEACCQVEKCLENGNSVVYDAPNLQQNERRDFLNRISTKCKKIGVLVATDIEIALEQNKSRLRQVPETVILRMYKGFNFPDISEGFDRVIIWTNPKNISTISAVREAITNHERRDSCCLAFNNHRVSTEKICSMIVENYKNLLSEDEMASLIFAASIHDIGKMSTKAFECFDDVRYNHNEVGAYVLACIPRKRHLDFTDEQWNDIMLLVKYHMLGRCFGEKKMPFDIRKLYGEKFQLMLSILHFAATSAY